MRIVSINYVYFITVLFLCFSLPILSANAAETPADFATLKAKAEKGDAVALTRLCRGTDAGKNADVAWCVKSVEQAGNIRDAQILGRVFEQGEGVPQDIVAAYKWYSLDPDSFEDFDRITQKMTADQIAQGKKLLAEWQERVAKGEVKVREEADGGGGALCIWSILVTLKSSMERCTFPSNVKKDLEEAYFWYSLAAAHSDDAEVKSALHHIGAQLTQEQRLGVLKRVQGWSPSRHGSNGETDLDYGYTLKNKDNTLAADAFLKSAQTGNAKGQFELGQLYAEGDAEMSDKDFKADLDGYIRKIDDYIIANNPTPVTMKDLEEREKKEAAPEGCTVDPQIRKMINGFKSMPEGKFSKALDKQLSVPAPPSMNPCL